MASEMSFFSNVKFACLLYAFRHKCTWPSFVNISHYFVLTVYNYFTEYFLVFTAKVRFFCKSLCFCTHDHFNSNIYTKDLGLSVLGRIPREIKIFKCTANQKDK